MYKNSMNLSHIVPLVIYDDRCYLCIKFAGLVKLLGGGKMTFTGHYSGLGEKLRSEVLDSSALEMFWFVDETTAYGGRAALLPLLKTIIFGSKRHLEPVDVQESCKTGCKNVKSVFLRSASLLSNSKTITIKPDKI